MEHVYDAEMELPLPRAEVFAFFADAANLQRITPPELHFEIVTPMPFTIGQGAVIDYRLRLFGIPFGWTTRITVWEPPVRFIDDQISGPYALWVHTHTFEDRGGSTLIRDKVVYRLPFSPLGELGHPLVRRQIERIFSYRQDVVRDALAPGRA
jgi:ligand-binding SRPBCC domain-containing protein